MHTFGASQRQKPNCAGAVLRQCHKQLHVWNCMELHRCNMHADAAQEPQCHAVEHAEFEGEWVNWAYHEVLVRLGKV